MTACTLSSSGQARDWLPGPELPVDTIRFEWHDPKRDRSVPAKFYLPKAGTNPYPVVIFSHGLGGSREGYGYLGRYWASHGYVVVHLQHLGSDDAIWQSAPPGKVMQAMRRAAAQPGNAPNRVADVSFALDQLALMNQQDGPMKGRMDMERVGLAGHSFGAMTTMAIAGEVFFTPAGARISAPDTRVKAAVAMSTPVPKDKDRWSAAFAKIQIPCFHMTGTDDDSPVGDTQPSERRVPFDNTVSSEAFLVIFKGGDHMVFTGMTRNAERRERDASIHNLIKIGSLAFWDACLKKNAAAKTWLVQSGFSGALGEQGSFEMKNLEPRMDE